MNLPDDLSKLILVSIRIPGLDLEPTNPARLLDALAGSVLRDLLAVELAAENLLTDPSQTTSAAFFGHYIFAVDDVRTAAAIIRSVLRRNRLESFATVFQLCPEEQVWKSIYPEGITLLHHHLAAENAAIAARAKEAHALWERLAQGANTPGNGATEQ